MESNMGNVNMGNAQKSLNNAWKVNSNKRTENQKKLVSNNSKARFNEYIRKEPIYNILNNIILATDSYKLTHWTMYKKLGITHVYSYLEARAGADFDHTVWFGLKYFLDKLSDVRITEELVKQSKAFVDTNVGTGYFNEAMWTRIANKHKGKLPVIIRAAPEGSVIPVGNALLTIENEDPECVGLVNHLESLLLQVWYPCTVATISKAVKDAITEYKKKTGEYDRPIAAVEGHPTEPLLKENGKPIMTNIMWTDHQLLDFGYRGASSAETAAIGGLAHLTNFMGSDTIAASLLGAQCYDMPLTNSYSVAATEHSIMTSLGKASEFKLLYALIEDHQRNKGGVLSLVMDSYNIFEAIETICNDEKCIELMSTIKFDSRGIPGKVVFRPDSGSPAEVIPIILGIIEKSKCGEDITEHTDNNGVKYKILPSYLGILWGDGMNPDTVRELLEDITTGFKKPQNPKNKYIIPYQTTFGKALSYAIRFNRNTATIITEAETKTSKKVTKKYPRTISRWAVRNFLFGMGGGLLQKVTRDTQNFAFKCSANKTTLEKTNLSNATKVNNMTNLTNSRPDNNRTDNINTERNSRFNNNKRNEGEQDPLFEKGVKGQWVAVIKDPITGSGKISKKGLLKLVKEDGVYKTLESTKPGFGGINDPNNLLQVVFKNGEIITKSIIPKINEPMNKPMNGSTNEPTNEPTNKPTNKPTNMFDAIKAKILSENVQIKRLK
jgi:nicotinamide phosphoribosyltransferase